MVLTDMGEITRLGPCPYEVDPVEEIYKGPWLGLRQRGFMDPKTRKKGVWQIAFRTTKPPSANAEATDIIPILKEGDRKFLILVKQYRIPIQGWSLEFPAGLVDGAENMEATGIRELKEETGYTASKVLLGGVSQGIQYLDPGMSNDSVNFLTVEVEGSAPENQNPEQVLDHGEAGMEAVKLPLEGLLGSLDACAAAGLHVEAMVYTFALGLSLASTLS